MTLHLSDSETVRFATCEAYRLEAKAHTRALARRLGRRFAELRSSMGAILAVVEA